MSTSPAPTSHGAERAFRTLHARLVRRRLATWDARLWVALLALCGSVGGFIALQLRLVFDHAVYTGASARTPLLLAGALAVLLVAALLGMAVRMRARLDSPSGPEWLALPVSADAIERHAVREARLPLLALLVPAGAVVFAAAGRVATLWLVTITLMWLLATWTLLPLVARLVVRLAGSRAGTRGAHPMERVLARVRPTQARKRITQVRFTRGARWRALARLDARLTWRTRALRDRLLVGALVLLVGALLWRVPGRPEAERQAVAFAAFLVAGSQWGAWAARRAAGDPAGTLRALPLSLGDRWRARAVMLLWPIGLSLLLPVVMAPEASWATRGALALVWAFPAAIMGLLGLNLGLAIPGRPDHAELLYQGWLGASVLASLAIPLLGWGMLGGAVVFSLRRLGRADLEELV